MFMLFEKPVLHCRCGDTDYQACIFTCLCVFICIRIVRFVNQEAIVSLSNDTSWKDDCHISFYNPDYITNIISAVAVDNIFLYLTRTTMVHYFSNFFTHFFIHLYFFCILPESHSLLAIMAVIDYYLSL